MAVHDAVGDERQQLVAHGGVVLELGVHVDLQTRILVLQLRHQTAQARPEVLHILQVAHAQAVALRLAAVGWPDALERGADLLAGQLLLLVAVDLLVKVEHDVRAVADVQAAVVVDACLAQGLQLSQQSAEVHHHAISDHAVHVVVQDAGRDQVELVLLAL